MGKQGLNMGKQGYKKAKTFAKRGKIGAGRRSEKSKVIDGANSVDVGVQNGNDGLDGDGNDDDDDVDDGNDDAGTVFSLGEFADVGSGDF